jgi:hypothetical protein
MPFNPTLLELAEYTLAVQKSAQAMMPPPPLPGPAGMPPGMPPQDPAMMNGMPPPMDPVLAGMPPLPPNPNAMPMSMPGAAPGQPAGQKLKPEQMMQMIDTRLYNMQQQITALLNAQQVKLDPATLVLPPGMAGSPPPEAALPGGPMDPSVMAAGSSGGGGTGVPPTGGPGAGGEMPPELVAAMAGMDPAAMAKAAAHQFILTKIVGKTIDPADAARTLQLLSK